MPEITKADIEKAIFEATGDKVAMTGVGPYWYFESPQIHHVTFNRVLSESLHHKTLVEWVQCYRWIKEESDTLKAEF